MTHHSMNIRVYYEDTDAGGVMYHGTHLNYGERGRTEFLRACGHQNSDLRNEFGVIFVVRHIDINYASPAFLDDMLRQETSISDLKNSSFTMRQTLYCENRNDALVSDMKVALVCIDDKTLRPVRLPEKLRKEFEQFLE
ncbi:MAG: YbgC/FadM family acyl-CoA thioesterase [Micavibrio sp.]|nr:YbgC/FadM family acyl-CoA thioesterase [Micavibrio sp.]